MRVTVTNLGRNILSLPNGKALQPAESIVLSVNDTAYEAVYNGDDLALLSKEDYIDAILYQSVQSLVTDGLAAVTTIPGFVDQVITIPLESLTAGTYPEDVVASAADLIAFVAPRAGRVKSAGLFLANTGADGTDPLNLSLDVKIGGTTCLATLPELDKTASDGDNTFMTGTGITAGVIDGAANSFEAGGVITIDFTLVRTTPEDEMVGAVAIIELQMA